MSTTRLERFTGAMVIMTTTIVFGSLAFRVAAQHPGWLGIVSAICVATQGCLAVASIWRDRL